MCQPFPRSFNKPKNNKILWFDNLGEEECVEHPMYFTPDVSVINLLGIDPLFYTTKEF